MGRQLLFGTAMLVGLAVPSAWPEAAGTLPGNATKFTAGWVQDEPTLRVEGRGVKFFKRIGRETVSLRVEVSGEVVEVEANTRGAVRVSRQGKSVAVQMSDPFELNIARVQKLTAGSKALDLFEGLVASLAANDSLPARSLRASHALLSAVRGVSVPMVPPPVSAAKPLATRTGFRANAEGPSACWADYATALDSYLVQFSSCVEDYWWVPGWNAACAFQFSLQGELAFFWLISCSGGMPV